MLDGGLPARFFVGRIFNISHNEISGNIKNLQLNNLGIDSFDISFNNFEGCYKGRFKSSLCQFSNEVISDGNQFNVTWENFCSCQAGICKTDITNFWIADEESWINPNNWSLRHVPLKNESVLIPPKYSLFSNPSIVHFPENYESIIYTLDVDQGAQIIIPQSSNIHVLTDIDWEDIQDCND